MIIIQIMWTIPRRWKARHGLMDWTNLARTPERAAPKAQPVLLSYESDTEASPSQPGFAWDLKLGFFRFTVMTRKPSTQYTTLNGGKLSKATKPLIVGYVTCLSRSERVQRDSVSKGSRMDTWTLPASGIRIGITRLRVFVWNSMSKRTLKKGSHNHNGAFCEFYCSVTGIAELHGIPICWVNKSKIGPLEWGALLYWIHLFSFFSEHRHYSDSSATQWGGW